MCLTGFDVECLSTLYIDKPMKAEVETFILDHLFMMLPEPFFSAEDKQVAAREVYSYVWNQSAAGHSFAGVSG